MGLSTSMWQVGAHWRARGGQRVTSGTLFFEMGFLGGLEPDGLVRLTGEIQASPVSTCLVMGLNYPSPHSALLCGAWGPNSGPHGFLASALLNEPSLQLRKGILLLLYLFLF